MRNVVNFALLVLCTGLALASQRSAEAVSIAVTGNWNLSFGENDLIGGAGTDLQSTYSSASNELRLTISGSTGAWRVDVRKSDSNWHANFVLKVRKTSGKTKPTVTVQDTDTEFFSDKKNISCNVQVILENVSVAIPADTYTTTLVFTVTDI